MKQLFTSLLCAVSLYVGAAPFMFNRTFQLPDELYGLPPSVMEMQMCQARSASKPTVVMKRMVANSYYLNGSITDSNRYFYSHGRGSANKGPDSYYTFYSMTGYNQVNNLPCDTLVNWHDYGSGFNLNAVYRYEYNVQNKVIFTELKDDYIWLQYKGYYNSGGMLERIDILDTFGATALTVKSSMYVIYDGQGKRIEDSTYSVINSMQTGRRTYTYDSNNNLIDFSSYRYVNSQWELSLRNTFTYDGQNRQITQVTSADYGNGFMNQQKDSFSYTGNNTDPSFHETFSWNDNTNQWEDYEILVYTFGNNSYYDGYTIYKYNNGWDTVEQDVYVYEGNDLFVRSNGYKYIGGGQFSTTPYDQSNLYFEEYYPASVLNNLSAKTKMNIFPNPAGEMLHVRADKDIAFVKIVASNGVVVADLAAAQHTATIDVSQLVQGVYTVVLTDKGGDILGSDRFVKQ
ncbi:MAG: T9SS type A sorting domain-containing protein [Chitinophagales bacterium]|nr:T9SS type A sorting domain-containing protein [Chitinophagales bacterium]